MFPAIVPIIRCYSASLSVRAITSIPIAGCGSKRSRYPARLTVKAKAKEQETTRKTPADYLRDAAKVSQAVAFNSACWPLMASCACKLVTLIISACSLM